MDRIIYVDIVGDFLKTDRNKAGVCGDSNAVKLYLKFDESWDDLSKRILWTDANGQNTVATLLQSDDKIGQYYVKSIPSEPMKEAGYMTFIVEGYTEGDIEVIAHTVSGRLKVADNYSTINAPEEPTPSQALQLQNEIDKKVDKITGKGLSTVDFSKEYEEKLNHIEENANRYVLPTAGENLGGVKTTSKETSTTGYTASPIIDGIPYYKDTTYEYATSSKSGLMSSEDKQKINTIEEGAEVNQAAYSEINLMNGANVNTSINPKAKNKSSVLRIKDGNETDGYIYDYGPNHDIGIILLPATQEHRGTMSKEDKKKIDEIDVPASIDYHNTSETAHEDIRKDVDSKANKTDVKNELLKKENTENKGNPNGYAPLDSNGKLPEIYLYGTTVKQYGVRWKGTSSTVCERLGDAVGLTAKAHKGSTESVDNDFDNIYPWSDIKTCNIDADGNVLAYLGEPSFARDGTNGDVMVEIPKFYYKRVKTGIVEEIWICGTKLPGYELHPLFIDNGKEVSKVFHSVYNASSFTDETDNKVKLQSITGVQPRVKTTRANFRTYAQNKGAIWGIEDISCVNALQLLYLVEYANTNSQYALGSGADRLSYTANTKALEETTNGNTITIASTYKNVYKLGQRIEIGTSLGANNITTTPRTVTAITTDDETGQTTITFDGDPITIAVGNMIWNVAPLNGSCDDLNGKSGWLAGENNYSDHYADVNYRGIEGFHAKLFRFIDGVNIKDRVVYYANSMADYANGVYDGKYRAVGYSNAEANGYVSAFGYDEKAPWVMFPSAAVGGSSTFVTDYYYQNTGERLLFLGGSWVNGTVAGAFYFDCSSAFSHSALTCGSHLLVKKP